MNQDPQPMPELVGLESVDFDQTPFIAIWETTRACDLACRHCRAEAIPEPLPGELSTDEGFSVLDQLAAMGTPICVLSGGDPAKRTDLCDLVRHGTEAGMRMATIPAGTPLLTRRLLSDLKEAGLAQLALSLDGPDADVHDNFRRAPGTFERTLAGAREAREVGLPLQINTTFSAGNWEHFERMGELVKSLDVVFWEVFFLVPMGRGSDLPQLGAEEFESMFEALADFADTVDFIVKVTEAPHYRRYLMQRQARTGHPGSRTGHRRRTLKDLPGHMRRDFGPGGSIGLAPKGVNSGDGHLFVSYCGEICPSGFLPIACGDVRQSPIADIYRTHPLFVQLRDADGFRGKCGVCEFRHICGGSRARAYAMTGDWLASEPLCAYDPATAG